MGYGAMRLCGPHAHDWCEDRSAPHRLLRRAAELGVDFIDTSDSYGPHINEEQIADALAPYPPGMVIATKGSTIRTPDDPARRDYDNSPAYLRAAVEGSLRRLKLEQLPLYQIHRLDGRTPLEDSLGELAELQREGKVAHIGLSEVDAATLETASVIAPIASVQNRFNLWQRQHEDVLEWCEAKGAAFIPWFPIGGGMKSAASDEIVQAVASELGATPTQVALAWLLARSTAMLLIPGTASVDHLEQNVAACDLRLDESMMDRLDALA
jgi:aryl-alcohol dehydrogenase-like predicted oxidoreductase